MKIQDGDPYLVDGVYVVSGCAGNVDEHLVRSALRASVVHRVSHPRGVNRRWDNCVTKVTFEQFGPPCITSRGKKLSSMTDNCRTSMRKCCLNLCASSVLMLATVVKCLFLPSAASSPLDRSKRLILHPWQTVPYQLYFYWKHFDMCNYCANTIPSTQDITSRVN